jgi:hypothetical protein
LEQDLLAEIARLSNSFIEVVKVAWNSEQRKQLESDLKSGLNSLVNNLETGFKEVSKSEQTKEMINKAEDVVGSVAEKVRQNKVAQEIGAGLVQGLRALSEQIDQLASELQSKNASQGAATAQQKPASGDAGQDIPIDKA